MHELFTKVLSRRDLSRAGDLFSVADAEIVDDLTDVLAEIDTIISQPDYQHNTNDQSVVEICVTRVLSCIRETKTAERHCSALVALLSTCQQHNLRPTTAHKVDPPHAKISADIISSIFLNYNKKPVMEIALPVAVKFLQKGNVEMSRNLASYLSLAAIEYASLLSPHVQPILDSICGDGNFGLCRLLSQIYEVAPEQLLSGSIPALVLVLPRCDIAERLALLQMFALIARQRPAVLDASVPQLCEHLATAATALATMQVLLPLAQAVAVGGGPAPAAVLLCEHFGRLRAAAQETPATVTVAAQIMATAGKVNKEKAQIALDFVLEHLPHADRAAQAIFLHEATMLCSTYPILFNEKVLACVRQRNQLSQSPSSSVAPSPVVLQPTVVAANHNGTPAVSATMAAPPKPPLASPPPLSSVGHKPSNDVNKTSGCITIVKLNAAPLPNVATDRTAGSSHTQPLTSVTKATKVSNGHHSGRGSHAPTSATSADAAPHVVTIHTTSSVVTSTPPTLPTAAVHHGHSSVSSSASAAPSAPSNQHTASTATTTSTTPNAGGGYTRRAKLGDSRSTGRLHSAGNTHRSMTRLNIAGGSVGGLHKSMTRLSSSQQINQQLSSTTSTTTTTAAITSPNNTHTHSSSGNNLMAGGHSGSTFHAPSHHHHHHHHHHAAATSAPPPLLSHHHHNDSNFVTPVPPLSSNVIITGHNRWGIPSTKITSGGVTVTTATSPPPLSHAVPRTRPHSQGPTTLGSTGALVGTGSKLSGSALNQSTGSIGLMQQMQQQQLQMSSPPHSPPGHTHHMVSPLHSPLAPPHSHHISVHHASPAAATIANTATSIIGTSNSSANPHPQASHNHHQLQQQQLQQPSSSQPLHLHHQQHNHQQQQQSPKSVMTLPVNSTFASVSAAAAAAASASSEVIVCGPLTVTSRRNNDNTSVTLLNHSSTAGGGSGTNSIINQRMSTFEPYQIMRDTVQQFCEKHFASIKEYMDKLSHRLPPPTRCGIEERRTKKVAKLHFACQIRGPHCLYSKTCFTMRTRNPKTWIHLMFLDFQIRNYVKDNCALSTREPGISNLKNMWNMIRTENKSFTELVTSNFPSLKEQEALVNELRHSGFLDVFEVSRTDRSTPNANELEFQWGCFLCNHPEKAVGFLHGTNQPMIEGQLKEKKGKWRLFRRWRTRYFTLSGAHLSCKGSSGGESIDVNQIRSVKVSRGARNIPKAFEIFTGDQTLILKPKDGKNAEEWVQCLSIVVAHSQARDNPMAKTNSLPARGLGNSRTAF